MVSESMKALAAAQKKFPSFVAKASDFTGGGKLSKSAATRISAAAESLRSGGGVAPPRESILQVKEDQQISIDPSLVKQKDLAQTFQVQSKQFSSAEVADNQGFVEAAKRGGGIERIFDKPRGRAEEFLSKGGTGSTFLTRALRFPEEKLIRPAIEKIRELPGSQFVISRTITGAPKLQLEASSFIEQGITGRRQPTIRTPINVADIVDIGSFVIPGIGAARAATFSGSVAGRTIEDPSFIVREPLEFGAGVLVGGAGILGAGKRVVSTQRARDILKLESADFKFIQTIDESAGKLKIAGARETSRISQQVDISGSILTTEKGRKIFGGIGISRTTGEFSPVLGATKGLEFGGLDVFVAGGKGVSIPIIETKGFQFFRQIGAGTVEPIASSFGTRRKIGDIFFGGQKTKEFSQSILATKGDKLGFSFGVDSKGLIIKTKPTPDVFSFRAGGEGAGAGTGTVLKQKTSLDFSQLFKPVIKFKVPKAKDISGLGRPGALSPGIDLIKPKKGSNTLTFTTPKTKDIQSTASQSVFETKTKQIPDLAQGIIPSLDIGQGVITRTRSRGRSASISALDQRLGQTQALDIGQIIDTRQQLRTKQQPIARTIQRVNLDAPLIPPTRFIFDFKPFTPIRGGFPSFGKPFKDLGVSRLKKKRRQRPSFFGTTQFDIGDITGSLSEFGGGIETRFVPVGFSKKKKSKKKKKQDEFFSPGF